MPRIEYAYCDGGLLHPNPSPHGIAWSCVYVFADGTTAETHHFAKPEYFGMATVENNLAETMGLLHCLEFAAGCGQNGTAFTIRGDNENSIRRAKNPDQAKFGGVPEFVRERLLTVVRKLPGVRYQLIGGSMTRLELARGVRHDGKIVSAFNVRADFLCRLELYLAALDLELITVDSPYPRPKVKCPGVDLTPCGYAERVETVRAGVKRRRRADATKPTE